MVLSSIQILTATIFVGALGISFIYDFLKNKKLRIGCIETTVVPILIGLIILKSNLTFVFTNNIFVSVIGLLFLIGGLIFGFVSINHLGKNKDDFWLSKKKVKKRELIISGPYSKIRHPIYTSIFVYYLGTIIVFLHFITIILYILLLVVVIYTALSEEKFLLKKFPKYRSYMKKTGRFLPKL